ncbi:hypothetical protein PIB30_105068, partial [Stylosanthes scabra]|nr:hypothetical protein [Stylosanthes scabra]
SLQRQQLSQGRRMTTECAASAHGTDDRAKTEEREWGVKDWRREGQKQGATLIGAEEGETTNG